MTVRSIFFAALILPCFSAQASDTEQAGPVAIAIHAGAGTIQRADLSSEQEAEIRATLKKAVRAGHTLLMAGRPGVDAVRAAINVLEDSPLFNAGKGAVFNAQAQNELDASIMDGASLNAGAVAALKRIRNPIDLAISVMNHSRHGMMIGEGAEQFSLEQGFELVDPSYFHTDHRLQQLRERQASEQANLQQDESWYSTVGAVVLDRNGNLAAGTSTGGLTNKRWGRIGDTPIIGAGNYANNDGCAVSATGTGEYFIRYVVAHSICIRVAQGEPIAAAARGMIFDTLLPAGGDGGVIAMDPAGEIAFSFNTAGMYRASIDRDNKLFTGIYADE